MIAPMMMAAIEFPNNGKAVPICNASQVDIANTNTVVSDFIIFLFSS